MTLKALKEIEPSDFRFTFFSFKCFCESFSCREINERAPWYRSNLRVDLPSDQSLPVAFGAETAKWICVGAIDITQISVAGT